MIITLSDLLAGIRARKAALGVVNTPNRMEQMRNKGAQRTTHKRAMLDRIEKRAHAAGVVPLKGDC